MSFVQLDCPSFPAASKSKMPGAVVFMKPWLPPGTLSMIWQKTCSKAVCSNLPSGRPSQTGERAGSAGQYHSWFAKPEDKGCDRIYFADTPISCGDCEYLSVSTSWYLDLACRNSPDSAQAVRMLSHLRLKSQTIG